jgi:hypothetical protein
MPSVLACVKFLRFDTHAITHANYQELSGSHRVKRLPRFSLITSVHALQFHVPLVVNILQKAVLRMPFHA